MLNAEIRYQGEDGEEKVTTVRESIIAAVKVGVPLRAAAQQAGIGERTLRDWTAVGREAQGVKDATERQVELAEFAADIEKAQGSAIAFNVGIVRRAASKQWQAAAWWLERRYPDDFGRRLHVKEEPGERKPAPLEPDSVAEYEEAFAASFGDAVPELDVGQLVPPDQGEPDE
jgi:hypothetical protein